MTDVCEWCGWPVSDHTDALDAQGHPIVVCPNPVKSGFPRHIWGPGAAALGYGERTTDDG